MAPPPSLDQCSGGLGEFTPAISNTFIITLTALTPNAPLPPFCNLEDQTFTITLQMHLKICMILNEDFFIPLTFQLFMISYLANYRCKYGSNSFKMLTRRAFLSVALLIIGAVSLAEVAIQAAPESESVPPTACVAVAMETTLTRDPS